MHSLWVLFLQERVRRWRWLGRLQVSARLSPSSEQQSLLQRTVQRARATKSFDVLVVLVNYYLPAMLRACLAAAHITAMGGFTALELSRWDLVLLCHAVLPTSCTGRAVDGITCGAVSDQLCVDVDG